MAKRARRSRVDNRRWEQLIASLRLMNLGFNNIRLYPPTHTEVRAVLAKLLEILAPILQEQEDIGFGFMDDLLYIEGSMSIEETATNPILVDRFTKCRVKYMTIMKGASLEDLAVFFQLLNAEAAKPGSTRPAELLGQEGVRTIRLIEADVDDLASKNRLKRKKTLYDWYEGAVGVLGAVRDAVRDAKEPDLKPLFRLVDDMTATIRSRGHEPYLLLPLLAGRLDPHLSHSVNVAVLCCALADRWGLNSGQINTLCLMALLHDLGRLTIPPEWTRDHAPLSEEDRRLVRQHADWSYLLLTRNGELPPQIGLLAAYHHDAPPAAEGGYAPDVYHRILALADHYDLASFSDRYYWKKHRGHRLLAHLLNERGGRHDETLVKLLVHCVGYFPVGSLVRLDDGRPGVVVRPNPAHPERPKLFMLEETALEPSTEAAGADEERPPVIKDLADLAEDGLGFARSIAAAASPSAGQDLSAAVDRKKEHLLSFTL